MKIFLQNSKIQAILFLVLCLFSAESVLSQTISAITVSPTSVCAGSTVTVTFSATSANGTVRQFTNLTTFQPYISAVGGGATYVALPTFTVSSLPATGSNGVLYTGLSTIITIPLGTTPGTIYKISLGCSGNPTINGSTGTYQSGNFTVVAPAVGGTISGSSTVCPGTNSTTLTLSGITGTVSKWQYSTLSDFSSGVVDVTNTTSTLTATNLSTTRYYRAVVVNGSCSANSSSGTITVQNVFIAGAIATTGETICYNGNPSLAIGSVTNASGGDNAITYKWQANGIDIPSTNVATFDPPSGLLTTTTFTRFAKDNTCNPAFTLSTGSWVITVTPASNGGTVTGGTSICTGSASGLLTLSGHVGTVVRWESSVSPFTVWTTIANTSTTYTSGTLTETTQFRAVVQNGVCPEAFTITPAIVTVGITKTYASGAWSPSAPTSIDTAIIADTFTSAGGGAGSFSACSLTVNTGITVVISSGDTITLSGALTATTGSFVTFNNNAHLIQSGSNTNSGAIVIKRNSASLMRLDYTLWSSPVASQNLFGFSPQTFTNRFYTYNQLANLYTTNDSYQGTPSALTSGSVFQNGRGYLIRMPNNHPTSPTTWEGQFTGVPNNGTVTLSSLTIGSFYAIGNPYPSTISANQFITDNSIGNTLTPGDGLYFWRKTNNSAAASYATYTTAGGVQSSGDSLNIVPNGVIQVGQGFIVKATSGSLNFNYGQRITDTQNQFLRTENMERHRIWLNLSDATTTINQMMLAYMTGATQGIDAGIDGRYFNDNPTALNSIVNTGEFAIQGRSLPFEPSDVVPLAFKATIAGQYSIAIDHVDGLFENTNQIIYLRDNLTTVVHNLTTGAYTFTSEAGAFTTRFEIIYQNTLSVDVPTFNANQVVIYKNSVNEFVINTGSVFMETVKIYDIRGRLLQEKKDINTFETTISDFGLSNGVLLLQITSVDGEVVTKKVVR